MTEHTDKHNILNEKISGYRKGHSITSILMRFRDDIIQAMKKGELTMAIYADFSKAFDTVDYLKVLEKWHEMKFSNHFLKWVLGYVNGGRQFVQVNDKTSELLDTKFGVPQGFILGPVLLNLYVNDLDEVHDCTAFQYADDTTPITHCFPLKLDAATAESNNTMCTLEDWSTNSNLLLNEKKTKQMIITTDQMSRQYKFDNQTPEIKASGEVLKRVQSFKFLGMWVRGAMLI